MIYTCYPERIARYEPWASQSRLYLGAILHDPVGEGRWVGLGQCPVHDNSVLIMSLVHAGFVECGRSIAWREEIHIDEPDA